MTGIASRLNRRFIIILLTAALLAPVALFSVARPALASFPGTNGRIAFEESCNLWTMNPDGTNQVQLTHYQSPADCVTDSAWSANGEKLAFADIGQAAGQIDTVNADGSNPNLVFDGSGSGQESAHPTWSPDGTRIAFAAFGSASNCPNGIASFCSDVDVVNASGTGLAVLLAHSSSASYAAPDWSPDGTTLAYTVTDLVTTAGSQVATLTLAGGATHVITPGPKDDTPSWSPDGTQIAFFHQDNSDQFNGIYRVASAGGAVLQLSDGTDFDQLPAWSPDGTRIAFHTETSGFDVWTMSSSDGSGRTLLTGGCDCVDTSALSWQPIVPSNTPTGSNVQVTSSGVTVTFASVQTSGNTTVTTSATGNPPPNGFSAGSPAIYYDLSTTAQFTPPVTVCVDVSGVTFPGTPALFHYVSGVWVNVTTSVSSTTVCGTVSTLSPFAVFGKTSPTPSLSIADASVLEGNGGTTPMTFNVTLSAPSAVAVTVNYATAAGTATAGADYVSTTGQLTFPANSTSRTITVQVIGDTNVEANETFTVTLSTPQNASISRATATGTIVNDDASPASRIHAHGNGSILSATRDQFDFDVASTKGLGKGHLNYADQAAKLHLDSTAITSVTCSGNHVTFTGSGRVNHTMVTFQVDAIDGGKGGHGDSFSIHWNGYSASGSLQSGDIRNSC